MRTTFRFLLIAIVGLGLLAAVGTGVVSWYVMRKLGPDFWVQLIEENTNCRADIRTAKLSLLTHPSTLKLKDVRLAPRDAEVAKAFDERAPMAEGSAPIVIPEVTLEVKLEDLLNRRLFIQRLNIVKPVVRESQNDEGHSSLEQLFSKHAPKVSSASPLPAPSLAPLPDDTPSPAVPDIAPVQPQREPAPVATAPAPAQPQPPSAAAAESPEEPSSFAISVASAEIEQGHLNIINKDATIDIQNLDFNITGLDLNPRQAAQPNQMHVALLANITVTGQPRIDGVKKPAELVHIKLSGAGDVTPIDPTTGEWKPSSNLKLTLAKGSTLGGFMTIGEAAGKDMKKLQEYGLDISALPIGGMLQQDTVVEGIFLNNRFTLGRPTSFVFPEYELGIEPKSWVNGAQDLHSMHLHLSCGADLQKRLESAVQAKVGDKLAGAISKAFADDRGRLTFDVTSSGPLSKPKVKFSVDRLLKNLLKGGGLQDLLQGLFGK